MSGYQETTLLTLADLQKFALEIAEKTSPPAIFFLQGDLGAGKTAFVKAYAEVLGLPAKHITSPTFAIMNSYQLPQNQLYHLDLYRLTENDFLLFSEIKQIVNIAQDYLFIEWPEKINFENLDLSAWQIHNLHFENQSGIRKVRHHHQI